jgi:RNA-directed DNA polymerase
MESVRDGERGGMEGRRDGGTGDKAPWAEVAGQANRILRGWANYFSYGTLRKAYRAIDNYVYLRVVQMLARRHKVSSRGTRQFPRDRVYGKLGIQRLQSPGKARRSWALA